MIAGLTGFAISPNSALLNKIAGSLLISFGLFMLAVNIGESPSIVESFVQSYSLSFPVVLDASQGVALEYNIRYIPTTPFIDRNGIIQSVKIGSFQSKKEIEGYLSRIIP